MRVSDCRVDPAPTTNAPPPAERPTLFFPAETEALVTWVSHDGLDPAQFEQFKEELRAKLKGVGVTLRKEAIFEAGVSPALDLDKLLPRKAALF